MVKEYLILLLLGHILGDFYFQTKHMAEKKDSSIQWVFIHGLCYWGAMLMTSFAFLSWKALLVATLISALHLVIDVIKFFYNLQMNKRRKMTHTLDRNVFFIDQFIHLFTLSLAAYWMVLNQGDIREYGLIKGFFDTIGLSERLVSSWCLALLILHKPANITIQKLLVPYKPQNKDEHFKKDNNAGRFIGTVERIIMLIFLAIGQYSAIGLVLTAKSIARYDRISKDQNFAEYYLLGTLISTLIVLVVSFIV